MTLQTSSDLQQRVAPVTVSFDGDAYVLGRADLGIFLAVPEPGAVFVTTLQETGSTTDAAARASEVAGEQVDGEDFLDGLTRAGLLDLPGGQSVDTSDSVPGRRRIRWIEGISPAAARHLFGRFAWSCYTVAAAFAATVILMRADLRPSWDDAWFLPTPALSVLVYVPVSILLLALHEAWHWLAGRALGVPSIFRVSYRGTYLVFETDLTQIVTVPRRHRYGAFLAGCAIDGVVLAVALGLRLLHHEQLVTIPATLDAFLAAVVLYQVVAIVWQWAAVPLRSDGYAVLANALRCHNLYRTTWLTAKRRLFRLTEDERAELAEVSDRDRRVARWFMLPYVGGILIMAWMFLTVVVPLAVSMATWIGPALAGLAIGSAAFWEAIAMAVYLVLLIGLPPLLALRERRMRRAGEIL